MVRASYLAMDLINWFVIVPFALASLFSGIVSAIGTKWGLLRHYWVLLKLLVTIACVTILLVHVQPIGVLAGAAEEMAVLGADFRAAQVMMVVASIAALPVLLFLTALSVYKLRGVTPYGERDQRGRGIDLDSESAIGTPRWVKVFGVSVLVLALAFVMLHVTGHGFGGHTSSG
jgi:hypothetical protein